MRKHVRQTGVGMETKHPRVPVGAVVQALIFVIAAPFLLDSWWTVIPAGVLAVVLVVRTALEDRTLQEELPGYRAYADQVRQRLIPGVW